MSHGRDTFTVWCQATWVREASGAVSFSSATPRRCRRPKIFWRVAAARSFSAHPVRVRRRDSGGFTDRGAVAFRIRFEGTADVIGAEARAPCSGRALASHGEIPMAFSRQQVSVTLHSRVLCACIFLVSCSSIGGNRSLHSPPTTTRLRAKNR